ncbi:MAG: hypothetical protein U1F50_12605 [Rubrivivax sp.]
MRATLSKSERFGQHQRAQVGDGQPVALPRDEAPCRQRFDDLAAGGRQRALAQVEVALHVEQSHHARLVQAGGREAVHEVGLAFGEDGAQAVLRHRHQFVAGAHQVASVHVQRLPARPAGHFEHQHTPFGVLHLVAEHLDLQPFMQATAGARGQFEGLRAHHLPRRPVGHAQHDAPAAFIGQRGAVLDELVEVEVVAGGLELDVLVLFGQREQRVEFLRGHARACSTSVSARWD